MHAHPLFRPARRPRPTHLTVIVVAVLGAILALAAAHARADNLGQWSPAQTDPMPGVQVHMALVRGDGAPFHSRVVWWGAAVGHIGVLGWRNDGAGCAAFPDPTLATGNLVPMPFSSGPPTQNLFCGGQTVLSTGELLSVGGSDATLEGLRDALTYHAASGISGGTWTPRTSMGQHRWYPTATVLRDPGRVLVAAGHKYDQLWSYGGRRDGNFPTGTDGVLLERCGRIPLGNWDPAVVTIAASSTDGLPPLREGHTLAHMDALYAPFMFGGRDGDGNSVASDVWYLTRGGAGDLDPDYQYPWTMLQGVSGTPPQRRSEHTALAVSAADMIVFGGVNRIGGGTETPLNELHRLWKQGNQWRWDPVTITSGTAPSARFGHTAVFDTHTYVPTAAPAYLVRRLIVFGGTTPGQAASDAKLYIFTFDTGTFASGTWSERTLTGGPGARYDHTMTLTPHPWNPPGRRLAWVYGGRVSATATVSDTKAWLLYLDADDPEEISWSSFTPDPDAVSESSPGVLSGHAAIYDPVLQKISFLGGSTAATPDRHIFQLNNKLPYDSLVAGSPPVSITITPDWGRGGEAAVSLANHAMALDPTTLNPDAIFAQAFARTPEIYDRGAASGGGTWTALPGAGRAPNYYPVNFLVPRTPFRADTCRVIEAGDDRPTRYLDIPASGDGAGPWNTLGHGISGFQPDPGFSASTGVQYRPGKILIAGGTPPYSSSDPPNLATQRTASLDVAATAGWIQEPDMANRRYYHNLVLVPTGGVLAIGGLNHINPNPKFYDSADIVLTPEYWEPGATAWIDYASSGAVIRNYHSTAVLLPDGRVLTGGGWGGDPSAEPPTGTGNPYWKKLQLFCPPYLFKADGATLASRPVINSAPATLTWRQRFTVCVDDEASIESACLIRPGATTHSVDMNQRFVPLTIEGRNASPPRLFLTAPASPDSAPPGDYLLFVLGSADGPNVPSIARWVRVQGTGNDLCDAVPGDTLRDLTPEIVGSTQIWFTWTATADDDTIAASGPARAFDLRYTYLGPITNEASWSIASWAQGEPTPGVNGTPHDSTLSFLQPCTTYYFALRSNDDNGNVSGIPAPLSVRTTCGGGGEEYSARQAGEEDGGASGSSAQGSAGGAGATPAGLPSSARPGAALAGGGSLQPTSGLLVVETRREPDGAWRVTLALRESPPATDAPPAITVEQERAGGRRDTLGRFAPGEGNPLLGLCALRERGRLGVPGVIRLERVEPHVRTRAGDQRLTAARHSRLGSLGDRFAASGGAVELAPGDSLVLGYAAAGQALADAASWYALVRRSSDTPPTPMGAGRGRPGDGLPARFALYQNRPNPFRGTTVITFDLPVETALTLEVFDLLGRRVATVAQASYPAGRHGVEWDLRDGNGARVRPGVYAYRLTAGAFRERRKMNVLE